MIPVNSTDTPIDREELVDEFGEDEVERQEWWSDEMSRVDDVRNEILDAVRDRDDVQLMRTGSSTSRDGRHEATFKLRIAGEPWNGGDSSD